MKINADVCKAAGLSPKDQEVKLSFKSCMVPLVTVCRLLGIPVPSGMPDIKRAFGKDSRRGGTLGETYWDRWVRQELATHSETEKKVCEWVLELTDNLTVSQFTKWTQRLKDGIWPWSEEPMTIEERQILKEFQWNIPFPKEEDKMIPLGFRVGPPYNCLIMDPSPMRQ